MSINKFIKENLNEKKYYLLIFVSVILFAVLFKIIPFKSFFSFNTINMQILKNKENITNLYNPREIDYTTNYKINKINFKHDKTLIHSVLGPLGFNSNFFIDFNTKISVNEDGNYNFIVFSDDGFNLYINDDLILDFAENRPYASNEKKVFLKKGSYDLKMSYYQGYGQLGLAAYYQLPFSEKKYFIGESSSLIKFSIK